MGVGCGSQDWTRTQACLQPVRKGWSSHVEDFLIRFGSDVPNLAINLRWEGRSVGAVVGNHTAGPRTDIPHPNAARMPSKVNLRGDPVTDGCLPSVTLAGADAPRVH